MKKGKTYRYSLQFPADTKARIRVGEALDRLGHRKSNFIVQAVLEYLDAHPNEEPPPLPNEEAAIYTKSELKELVMSIMRDMSSSPKQHPPASEDAAKPTEAAKPVEDMPIHIDAREEDIDAMFRGLDLFN